MADKKLLRFERELADAEKKHDNRTALRVLKQMAPHLLNKGRVEDALKGFKHAMSLPKG